MGNGKQLDVALISDLHFGHDAIAKIRGFDDVNEYNEEVIKRFNSVTGKRTMTIIAGDLTMENKKYFPLLNRLNGRKIVVLGNHDLRSDSRELLKYVESVAGALEYKGCIITHIPIHSQEASRYRLNIHGHLHEETIKRMIYNPGRVTVKELIDNRYFNISWDRLDGVPISFQEIIQTAIKV